MKFEYKAKEAIFIAPKCYYIKTENDEIICKIKGYTDTLSKEEFKKLLYKDNYLEKSHNIFKKDNDNLNIKIIKQSYNIKMTNNKRELIFDKNNKLILTKPK